jgi:hypothetical protein
MKMSSSRFSKFTSLSALAVLLVAFSALAPQKAQAVTDPTQAIMGQNYTMPLSSILSAENKTQYANDCTASQLTLQITSEAGDSVLERNQIFSTEHCFSKASQWTQDLLWEGTTCYMASDSCVGFPNGQLFAAPGTYTASVSVTVGFANLSTLTNTFPITVLPSYFYVISANNLEVYPFKDGIADNVEGSIGAFNESAQSLDAPITKIGLKQGNKVIAKANTDSNGFFSIPVPKTAKEDLQIVIVSIPNAVGGRKWLPLETAPSVTVKQTKISSLDLSAPADIYPSVDGFKDKASISYGATVTTGEKSTLTGSLTIANGSKVVKTVPFGATGTKKFVWDGKVNGNVVPGNYTITVSATGPEGGTVKKSKTIAVSGKKMVYTTLSRTYGAYTAADESQGDSYEPIDPYGSIGARFYSSGSPDLMLVKLSVPINPATVKWRIKFNDFDSTGDFAYHPCRTSDCLFSYISTNTLWFSSTSSGYAWTPWANLGGSVANFEIVSTDWASLYVDSFTVEYVVKTLK